MKNLRQVQMIQDVLNKEREKLLMDLSKINLFLNKKIASLQTIIAYQKEYTDGKHLNTTRMIPALHKNLNSFSKKMKDVILHEEREIENLVKVQKNKLNEIETVDKKVKLMSIFSESILSEMTSRLENIEQMGIDDLSANKQSRGGYE